MPLYQFESKHGNMIEEFFYMKDAPKIGSRIRRQGRVYSRVPNDYNCIAIADRNFVSKQLPLNYKHHRGEFDKSGRPVFTSKQDIIETVACSRDNDEGAGSYDYE